MGLGGASIGRHSKSSQCNQGIILRNVPMGSDRIVEGGGLCRPGWSNVGFETGCRMPLHIKAGTPHVVHNLIVVALG
jgi:hypothetical protein